MTAPGQPIPYFVLDRDGFYYTGFQQKWTSHLHYAAMLSETLAERLVKRYPRATIEQQMGYEVNPKEMLEDVGEPEAIVALQQAVQLCARDGLNLPTILTQVESAFHNASRNQLVHVGQVV